MKTQTFGKLTAVVLERDYPHGYAMLRDLCLHRDQVAFINEVTEVGGITDPFIATDPNSWSKDRYVGNVRVIDLDVARWQWRYGYRKLEGGMCKGDFLILNKDLETALALSRGRLEG